VPTVLRLLLTHPAFREVELSRLKMLIGGSALTADLAQAAKARGIRALAGYGLSETCPVVALAGAKPAQGAMDGEAALSFATCAGFPLPMVRAAIVDEEGQPLPPGRENPGELILQAPWLTQGYFKNEEESRQLWRDGWLHTGDMAYLDAEGYVRVTDRLKDVIKLGGEWISSLELENALNQHEAVAEAAVIGMPEPKWGECPHAAIVLRPGFEANVSSKEILEHLRQFIERGTIHKRAILTRIQILDRLPKTSVGKLDKKALRALVGRQP
jgi:fatty-acyl-CoA synthase